LYFDFYFYNYQSVPHPETIAEKPSPLTMATNAFNLPKASLVLVTGANGFVASHVVDRLLEDGFNVRGSVRSEDKGKWLHEVFDTKYGKGRFETVVVPDMEPEGAFDAAVKGVAGICHTASIMTFVDKPEQVIPTVVRYAHHTPMRRLILTFQKVKGATNIVAAALKEPSVKSLVYTSSSTAALLPQPNKRIEVTKATWNEDSVKAVKGPSPNEWEVRDNAYSVCVWKALTDSISMVGVWRLKDRS
jgi:nucleoside-diphosphate-sugar epimerase